MFFTISKHDTNKKNRALAFQLFFLKPVAVSIHKQINYTL
ncbi:hypothetical protein SAMN04487987_10454 [Algibacter pectinivorans]|uniref:Uncharacterized protein n=1 Tax=Algibacter pectinivorans TaxID=870482 RepID=A0A1I1PYM3_9FLAO|nr:hypothetical protein SAMN04487987_10454 [Algibacter pectinivorans]